MADLDPPLFRNASDYRDYFVEEVKAKRIPREPAEGDEGRQERKGKRTALKDRSVREEYVNMQKEAERVDDIAVGRTSSPKSPKRQLSLSDLVIPDRPSQRTQPRLPTPQATEEPAQLPSNFGSATEESKANTEVQKDLLTKIFDTLLDISKNVSLMTEGFPDLLEASKSVEKLKDTNNLKKEEEDREGLTKRLKGNLADAGISLVSTGFGFFEKLFALLTPFIAGFLLSFTDLLDPVKLLKQALLLLATFITGKLIYQLGKAVTFTLLERLKEKFISGPKVINAPNSVINAGGVGTGTGGVVTTGTGDAGDAGGKKKKPRGRKPPRGRSARAVTALLGAEAITAATTGVPAPAGGVVPAGVPAGAPAATGALSKIKGLAGSRAIPILGTLLTLASAPFQYMSKREEGKTKFRAGTETAASITGVLGGAAAGAALGTAIGGPIGAVIGGAIGAYGGEKLMSSITEGLFNFFTGTDYSKKMSVFSEEYANLPKEERLKIKPTDYELDIIKRRYKVESLQSFTTDELLRAQKDIITAREKDPAKASNQNYVVQKGGDTTNNRIINLPALEAEISRRGLPLGGLGAK